MVHANVQILPDRVDPVWVHVVHVWLACPREGDPHGAYSPQVRYLYLLCPRISHPMIHVRSLLAAEKQSYFRTFMIASIAGIYSLFPLIFTPAGKRRFCPSSICVQPNL